MPEALSGTDTGNEITTENTAASEAAPKADTTKSPSGKADAGKDAGKASSSLTEAADWRSGLEGDELEIAKRYASPQDMAKAHVVLRKNNSAMIRLPGKDAKPEDVSKFVKAIGAGETPEDYKFAIPEGAELTDADRALQTKVQQVLHKHHVPVSVASELQGVVEEVKVAVLAEQERVAVQGRQSGEATLRKEWGADYEANKELAARAARELGGETFLQFVSSTIVNGHKLGDHPEFVRAFGTAGRRMGEGTFIGAVGAEQRGSLEQELDQIYRDNPPGSDKYKRPEIQKRIREINVAMYGEGPVTGRGGRTF